MKHALTILALLLAPLAALHAADGPANVRIVSVSGMDRWIDLEWTCDGNAPGGFALALSLDGREFATVEKVGDGERKASVFLDDRQRTQLGPQGMALLRVAALGGDGKPFGWSQPVSVKPGARRDVEAELRQRFDYPANGRPYNCNDPAYAVVYTDEQKQRQRDAARAMFAELDRAAHAPQSRRHYVIPPGIYRVAARQFKLSDVADFTIHGPGAQFIIDSETSGAAFTFENCSDITLTGRRYRESEIQRPFDGSFLLFDSEQLPMSVCLILAVDIAKRTVDVEILPGYSIELPDKERMLAYDPAGNMINTEQMGWIERKPLGERRFRLTSPSIRNPRSQQRIFKPGILLALHNDAAHKGHTHSVFGSHNCRNMTYESIRVVSGGGSPADHGTAGYTIFRDWRNYPLPGTSRLAVTAGLGQFSKNGGTFIFEDCEFGPHLDDGINLLSGMSVLGRQESPRTLVVTGSLRPTPGSTLTFYDYTSWAKLAEAKVVSSEQITDQPALDAVNEHAARERTVQNARKAFRTQLDRDVTLAAFAMVVHSDYRADGIIVRNCLFRDQLAQIMLLQGAYSGLIENNLLLRSTGAAISPQFSQYWWEGPMPSHFFIRNNVIRDNPVAAPVTGFEGSGSISVYAGTKHPSVARLLKDFRIEGNLIINPSMYGIVARNAERVVIRHNRIVNPGACQVEGMFRGTPIADLYAAICLDAVSDAQVSDNEIVFGNDRCRRSVLLTPTCDPATIHVERNTQQGGNEKQ